MIVLKGGRILDAAGERTGDVLIGDDGRIAAIGADLSAPTVIDAGGCVITPWSRRSPHAPPRAGTRGIRDGGDGLARCGARRVHRGRGDAQHRAAIDSAAVVRDVLELGRKALCDVYASGAITVGRAGEQLAPMAEMAALGVRLFTDDGNGVQETA